MKKTILTMTAALLATFAQAFDGIYSQDLVTKAKRGDAESQFDLALCYMNGKGVKENPRECAKWLRKAAEQGLDCAQYSLGAMYRDGDGVKQDMQAAAKWYAKATARGNRDAMAVLLSMAGNWMTIPYSEELAAKVAQGNAEAMFYLGKCYRNGQGR